MATQSTERQSQKKTGRPVKFELTEQTRQVVDDYLAAAGKKPGEFLFTNRRAIGRPMTVRQYARLVSEWVASIGLDPRIYSTHSLRRTKVTLIYRRTANLRAVQLLLGHTKIESTVTRSAPRLSAGSGQQQTHAPWQRVVIRSPHRRGLAALLVLQARAPGERNPPEK